MNVPWSVRPSRRAWSLSSHSCVPEPATRNRTPPTRAITPSAGQRLQRVLEALLIDKAADEQDELLLGRGELRAEAGEILDGLQVVGVDPVGRHDDALLVDPEDVGDVAAHVVRADQHLIGDMDHPALGAVDV